MFKLLSNPFVVKAATSVMCSNVMRAPGAASSSMSPSWTATTTSTTSTSVHATIPLFTSVRHSSTGSSNKDYYKLLGVSKTASKEEIKKAYRKRAMETHPDQGGKPDEFQQVNEAYEVLSNEERRSTYDRYGSEAAQQAFQGGATGHRSAEDIFNEFFGRMGGMGNRGRPQVQDLEVKVEVTLEELASGVQKQMRVNRPSVCSACRGNGTKNGDPKPECIKCHGRGRIVEMQHMGGSIVQTLSDCGHCRGTGKMAKIDDMCQKCSGKGYKQQSEEITIPIQAGLPSNIMLRMPGEGGTVPDADPGDLIIHVVAKPHKVFTRRGDDLLMNTEITFSEALLGFEKSVKLLDGRTACITSPPGEVLQSTSVLKVMGEGMVGTSGTRGDLYILVNVKMPKMLTEEQKSALEKVFGKPHKDNNASAGNILRARVIKESKEQFMAQKSANWEKQESMNGGGNKRGGRSSSQGAECVQQ